MIATNHIVAYAIAALVLAALGKLTQYLHFAAHAKKGTIMGAVDGALSSFVSTVAEPVVSQFEADVAAGKSVNIDTYVNEIVADVKKLMSPILARELKMVTTDVEGLIAKYAKALFPTPAAAPVTKPATPPASTGTTPKA